MLPFWCGIIATLPLTPLQLSLPPCSLHLHAEWNWDGIKWNVCSTHVRAVKPRMTFAKLCKRMSRKSIIEFVCHWHESFLQSRITNSEFAAFSECIICWMQTLAFTARLFFVRERSAEIFLISAQFVPSVDDLRNFRVHALETLKSSQSQQNRPRACLSLEELSLFMDLCSNNSRRQCELLMNFCRKPFSVCLKRGKKREDQARGVKSLYIFSEQ